jgi:hypothetical protein
LLQPPLAPSTYEDALSPCCLQALPLAPLADLDSSLLLRELCPNPQVAATSTSPMGVTNYVRVHLPCCPWPPAGPRGPRSPQRRLKARGGAKTRQLRRHLRGNGVYLVTFRARDDGRARCLYLLLATQLRDSGLVAADVLAGEHNKRKDVSFRCPDSSLFTMLKLLSLVSLSSFRLPRGGLGSLESPLLPLP